ncbi:EamA/RhaT family transporter [Neorhizobium sp. P12A]|jgi:drug/metabolite transporter (DMT)-like permease|uniref:DMT family transporter n=1 Tax=Neorhizobium sp. P12A TaxID=2268027 RepID=UPI0011EE321C|nr:DMT family transporter [Neorhizobium sp. P12A]KAA0697270.1 EamA/RhaT family transporter [Neorhizobium sp. P12A]
MTAITGDTGAKSRFDVVAFLAIVVTIVFWASSFVVIRVCLGPLTPVELATARYVTAGLIAFGYLAFRWIAPSRQDFLRISVAAILFIAAYAVLLNTGEQTVPAGPASFIINTMPVFTALIATFVLGERFGHWGWFGTAVSFGGVALIAVGADGGFGLDPNAVLILGAALCSAVASVLQKPVLGRMPALTVTAWVLLIGSVPLFPAVPTTVKALIAAPAIVNWSVAYLVIFPTAIGYVTWAIALKRLSAARATNFLYGVPPTATLVGFLWLGEAPSLVGAIGGAMAILGVVIVNVMRRR